MPFWQRSLILLAAVMAVSFIVGIIWHSLLGFYLPGYISGVVGGLSAVLIWDLLKKAKPK
jgi:cytochrome b subunit of formate dehydrogenase